VARRSPSDPISARSIARQIVIRRGERQAANMNKDLFRSLLAYKSIMAQAKVLLRRGIITRKEYAHFDTMFTKKYGLSLDSIFREKS
jgi:hypothetical protein